MLIQLDYLRDLNTASVFIRLILALILGGLIGLDRALRHRPAGPRTYALVCVGAALTMVLSQYEYVMLTTDWAPMAEAVGLKTDHRHEPAEGQGPHHRVRPLGLRLSRTRGRLRVL